MAPLAGLLRSHALYLRTDATRSCRMSGRCNLPMRGAVALIGSFPTADIEDIEDCPKENLLRRHPDQDVVWVPY